MDNRDSWCSPVVLKGGNEYFAAFCDTLDLEALRLSIAGIVDRHTALRSRFSSPGSIASGVQSVSFPEPLGVIQQASPDVNVVDCSESDEGGVIEMVLASCHKPFSKTSGAALLRVLVYQNLPRSILRRLPKSLQNIIVLAAPDVAVDKWSLSVLLDDIIVMYSSFAGSNFRNTDNSIRRQGVDTMRSSSDMLNKYEEDEQISRDVMSHVLSPVEMDYFMFSQYRKEHILEGTIGDKMWAFWQNVLSGPMPALNLPTDRLRPHLRTYGTSVVHFTIGKSLRHELLKLVQNEGCSLRVLMCAIFHSLLFRYTSQNHVLLGITTSCRIESEIRQTVGSFENVVPLKGDFSGNPTLKMLLKRQSTLVQNAEANSALPLSELCKRIKHNNSSRDKGRHPLIDVNFYWEAPTTNERNLPDDVACLLTGLPCDPFIVRGVNMKPLALEKKWSPFDLQLTMAHSEEILRGALQYNTDLFNKTTIERMAVHFTTLLQSAISNPSSKISELGMITPIERNIVVSAWNSTKQPFDLSPCVHELVEAQVERTPDATAVVGTHGSLTYSELNSRANRLANHLRFLGVVADTPVPVFLERSPDLIVALLAVLKSGGACMPLDPKYPKDRISYMFSQAKAMVVITESKLKNRLPDDVSADVIILEEASFEQSSSSDLSPVKANGSSRDLAYIIYTSGSTGRPKGVMLEHRSLLNYLTWHIDYYEMTSNDRVLHNAGLAFDASMAETWPTLAVGGTLYLLTDLEIRLDPTRLLQWMGETRITLAFLTTQLCEAILEEKYPDDLSLRYLYTGGDKLHRGPTAGAPFTLVNIYGPTENTINTTMCHVACGRMTPPPIGRPVPNTQVYILDRNMKPCPVGIFGELYLAGVQLARGYFCRDDLTAERFVQNPFSDGDPAYSSEVMYKTGDLVRWLPDGQIEFFGRIDTQVKIRGFRIELGAIESTLYALPSCREVCVVAREDIPGDKRLVAYIVSDESSLNAGDLKAYLGEKLPSFMIPSSFVFMDTMPLTPNDKIDRRALPAPSTNAEDLADIVAPRNDTEKRIAKIYASILCLDNLSVHMSFLDLGGHSLLAARIMSLVRKEFRVECPLSALFANPTVAGLSKIVQSLLSLNNHSSMVDGSRINEAMSVKCESTLSLSYNERSLWYLNIVNGKSDWSSLSYNIPWAARFKSSTSLSVDRLRSVFQALLDRHESLRTNYSSSSHKGISGEAEDGQPIASVQAAEPGNLSFESYEIMDWNDTALKERMLDETYKPFDLEHEPLLRVVLYSHGRNNTSEKSETDTDIVFEYAILVIAHHIAVDLWSFVILLKEFSSLYCSWDGSVKGNFFSSVLPAANATYREYVESQMQVLLGGQGDKLWAYWKSQMISPLPVLHLPTDRPRPPLLTHKGSAHIIEISQDIMQGILSLCSSSGVTVYVLLLSAFQAFLSRYSGQDDIIIGTPMACREDSRYENTVGYFVNPVPIRSDLSGDPTMKALLQRTSETVLNAIDHQSMPFSLLVERLQPLRDPSRSPLFDVMFVLQRSHTSDGIDPRYFLGVDNIPFICQDSMGNTLLEMQSIGLKQRHAQFDLTLMMTDNGNGLTAAFQYNTDLFNKTTIERMAVHFTTLLQSAISNPSSKISELGMITPIERNIVVSAWNSTKQPFDLSPCVHELVEAQVERTPDATAVVGTHGSLTYSELNSRANRLANHLRFLGVVADTPVPVFLERSPDLIVALLAVLKSGGACMPLDPKYPKDRISYMFSQAKAMVVITESKLKNRLPDDVSADVIILEEASFEQSSSSDLSPVKANGSSRDLAYIIYTSGSTGRPKGVMLEHRSLLNYLTWHIDYYEMTSNDRVLHNAGLAFDASMAETWPTLAVGGTLYLLTDLEIRLDPTRLLQWMGETRITLAFLTTQLCEAILEEKYPDDLSLRYLYTGGDKLHRGPTAGAPFTLVNIYGPTENTINTTMCHVACGRMTPPPIGRPVPNTQVYILDRNMKPCPVGIFGELYLAGVQLARGYFCRDDLTAERFVQNPFSDGDPAYSSEVMYKTGDLVRWLPDGQIEFFGRIDTQVKIRGFRIELGAIESTLYALPSCREVCVVAREDIPGDKRLVAYIVSDESSLNAGDLKAYLGEKLPSFMIPSSFVFMDTMPLTPNDKIDRRALPAPSTNAEDLADIVAPRSPIEECLLEIWCEVLNVDKISINSSFFDLGGHSLLAARLMSRVRSKLGVNISISKLFDDPTVMGLAQIIETHSLNARAKPEFWSRHTNEVAEEDNYLMADCTMPFGGVTGSLLRTSSLLKEQKHRQSRLRSQSENIAVRGDTSLRIRSSTGIISPSSVSASVRDSYLSSWMQREYAQTEDFHDEGNNLRTHTSVANRLSLRSRTVGDGSFLHQSESYKSRGKSIRTTSAQLTPFRMTPTRARRTTTDATNAPFEDDSKNVYSTVRSSMISGFDESYTRSSRGSGLKKVDLPPNSYPLSFNQRSLWFLHKVDPNRVDYVVHHVSSIVPSFSKKTVSSLDIKQLRLAFEAVCIRHPSLSTVFDELDGVPFQRPQSKVHKQMFTITDSSYWTQDQLKDAIILQLNKPWNLLNGPVFRVNVYQDFQRHSSGNVAMLITAHHIAMDGISLDILFRDVVRCYREAASTEILDSSADHLAKRVFGKSEIARHVLQEDSKVEADKANMDNLSNREIKVFEFASLQADYICSTEGDRLWRYWQRELAGHPPSLNLHTDFKRPPVQDTSGDWVKVRIDADLVNGMRNLVQNERVTMYTGLLTVFQIMLHRYSGQDDILVGSPFSGRHPFDEGLTDVIGNFANPVVLRSSYSASEFVTFRKMLKRTWGKVSPT